MQGAVIGFCCCCFALETRAILGRGFASGTVGLGMKILHFEIKSFLTPSRLLYQLEGTLDIVLHLL
jgi:hypothetical protein